MTESAAQSESLLGHRLALARELLDELELAKLPPEALLLKASRLARLMEASEIQEWISLELKGYLSGERTPVYEKYKVLTGRLTDPMTERGYWQPLAGLIAWIQAMEAELRSLRVPDLQFSLPPVTGSIGAGWATNMHVQTATAPVGNVMNRMATLTGQIAELRSVVSRVIGLLHEFAAKTYYELAFRGLAESIFESHRKEVDALLAKAAGSSLEKIPAIAQRLSEGDGEAISHAMTTGRRVLAAFADAVQPPQEGPLIVDGKQAEATGEKYLNRLHNFIITNCKSENRKKRLRETVVHLNTRFAAAVHAEVTAEEARALFVLLYITLGEILSMNR